MLYLLTKQTHSSGFHSSGCCLGWQFLQHPVFLQEETRAENKVCTCGKLALRKNLEIPKLSVFCLHALKVRMCNPRPNQASVGQDPPGAKPLFLTFWAWFSEGLNICNSQWLSWSCGCPAHLTVPFLALLHLLNKAKMTFQLLTYSTKCSLKLLLKIFVYTIVAILEIQRTNLKSVKSQRKFCGSQVSSGCLGSLAPNLKDDNPPCTAPATSHSLVRTLNQCLPNFWMLENETSHTVLGAPPCVVKGLQILIYTPSGLPDAPPPCLFWKCWCRASS